MSYRYHEAHPLEYNFQASNTSIIGRGPGLLSAAAVGLSPSISMIPSIAEHITRVAFRFGLVVDLVCRSLEVSSDEINAEGVWIYCAHGADEKDAHEAVARFNIDMVSQYSSVIASMLKSTLGIFHDEHGIGFQRRWKVCQHQWSTINS